MAQKVTVVLIDDIDGTDADETVRFAIDDDAYEIDLSADNAAQLRQYLARYADRARRVGRAEGEASAAAIRAWARDNGWDVPTRGRVSAEIRAAYDAAHESATAAST